MTQKQKISNHLQVNRNITTWDAIQLYRITRLSEYIRQLREDGWIIENLHESFEGKHWDRYVVVSIPFERITVQNELFFTETA